MQRDVEFEIDSIDKSGGFIGTLWVNKTDNAAIALVKEGLASVHDYSAETLSWARQLYDAQVGHEIFVTTLSVAYWVLSSQAEAQKQKVGMWTDYDETAEKEVESTEAPVDGAQKTEYFDVIVSDVRPREELTFSVQKLNTEGIAALEQLMRDFSLHHRTSSSAAPFTPKAGDLVSAKFSDGSWYRAKVKRASSIKKEAEVTFIDYGNQDTVAFANIRPLEARFRSLPGQAHDARLRYALDIGVLNVSLMSAIFSSFVKLLGPESEYYAEAIDRFRQMAEGRKLIANVDHKEGNLLHLRLIDPNDPNVSSDPLSSINVDLVREGLAAVDRKNCKYLSHYGAFAKRLQQAVAEAKGQRLGMFEYGDVEED